MQEYVEERTIAISVKAAKLSGKVLAAACKKVFAEIAKQQEAAKRPKKIQRYSMMMLICIMIIYLVVLCTEVLASLGAFFG